MLIISFVIMVSNHLLKVCVVIVGGSGDWFWVWKQKLSRVSVCWDSSGRRETVNIEHLCFISMCEGFVRCDLLKYQLSVKCCCLIWDLSLSNRQGRFKRSNSVTAAVQADLELEGFPLMEDKGLQFGGGFQRHSEPSTPTQYGAVRTVRTQGLFSYREDYRTPTEPPSPQRSPEPWLEPSPREPIATVAVTVTPPQPTDSGRASPSCRRDGSWFMQLLHTETKKMEGWCKELEGEAEENDLSEESELTELRIHEPLNLYIIIFVCWRVWLQVSKCQVWIQRSVTFNRETFAELQVIRGSHWECCHVSNYVCQHLSGFHGKELRAALRLQTTVWERQCTEMNVWESLWEYSHTFRMYWQSHTTHCICHVPIVL